MTEMLQIPAVAKILDVSEWVVNDLLKKGVMEGYKISGTWRVTQEQIDAYLERAASSMNPSER